MPYIIYITGIYSDIPSNYYNQEYLSVGKKRPATDLEEIRYDKF